MKDHLSVMSPSLCATSRLSATIRMLLMACVISAACEAAFTAVVAHR